MTPTSAGYVDVGELELYLERYGQGDPLVLLHGAMGTIESCFAGLVPLLARHFEVLAVELQGHGHTRDIARPLTHRAMACDVAALLDRVRIPRAHCVGYSMGGAVAFQLALENPGLVDHLVWAGGASFNSGGLHPELLAGLSTLDPHQLDGTPWHEAYRRVAPDRDAWAALVAKVHELDLAEESWSREQLAALDRPTLLVIGDADIVRPEHTVEMFRLLGGGVPGDLVGLPASQLAVLPGTSHVGVLERADWLSSMILAFIGAGQHR